MLHWWAVLHPHSHLKVSPTKTTEGLTVPHHYKEQCHQRPARPQWLIPWAVEVQTRQMFYDFLRKLVILVKSDSARLTVSAWKVAEGWPFELSCWHHSDTSYSWESNFQQLPRSGREVPSRGRRWTSQLIPGGESSQIPRGLGHALLTVSFAAFSYLLHCLLCNSLYDQFHKIIENHLGDQALGWGDYFDWVDWSEKTPVGGTIPYTGLLDHNKRGKLAKHKLLSCSSWLWVQRDQLLHAPLWLPHHNGL